MAERSFQAYLERMEIKDCLRGIMDLGPNKDLGSHIAIGGRQAVFQKKLPLEVLAMMSCYNDEDIIENTVMHLIEEGITLYIIDNWSSDNTWAIVSDLQEKHPENIIGIERFPYEGQDQQYNWDGILKRKEEIAQNLNFDWFIHYDSDEIRTSCWPGVKMIDAISFIDSLGYNAINHFVIDFRPTKDGFSADDRVEEFFSHFERNTVSANKIQIKAWKKGPVAATLHTSGGHIAWFPDQKVYPFCFLLSHFSLRSCKQAITKVYQHRLPRIIKENKEKNFHGHYERYKDSSWLESEFIWDEEKLIKFDKKSFFSDFLLPRLVGE